MIYGKPSRNAFHGLSKRLQDSLIDFIAAHNFETETSEEFDTLKLLLTARVLYERSQPKIAHKILKKAMSKAKEHDLFSILGEILHTQIQYAHLHPEVNLDALFDAFNDNQEQHKQQENLNLASAYLKQQLQQSSVIHHKKSLDILQSTFKKFNISINPSLTIKSFYQILDLVNATAHLEHNFMDALPFIEDVYHQLQPKQNLDKHRFYHIQILYFLANAYFRNKQFDRSQEFLTLMFQEMQEEQGKYASRFRESYLLIKTLNLNYSGKANEAIKELEDYFATITAKKIENPDLILSLVTYYAQQEQYKQALRTLHKLRHTDGWYRKRMGADWVTKKELITLIIYLELGHINLLESAIKRFKRTYKHILKGDAQINYFFAMIQKIYFKPEQVRTTAFRELLKTHFTTTSGRSSDVFMISFFAWLKAKNEQKSLYAITLDLINKSEITSP